jgi:DNA-binding Lrp family transcriptional regulator
VYFKVSYISKKKFEKLISYLVSEPHTSWVATCVGRYDIVCTFFASNPSQFNKTLRGIMSEFPDQLQNYTVLTTVVNREFGRKYLFRAPSFPPEIIFGGDREPEDIDEIDMEILGHLSADARKSSVKISQELSVTPKTVIQRIRKLRDREVILSFKPLLDLRKMNYVPRILVIRYHNVSSEPESELIQYLKVHPHVTKIVKTLGEWDIEIFVEAEDAMELRRIEMRIRQKFAALVQQIESIPIYQTYKENYFPRFLLGGQS